MATMTAKRTRVAAGRVVQIRATLVLRIDGTEYQVKPFQDDFSGKSWNEMETRLTGPDGVSFSVYWRNPRDPGEQPWEQAAKRSPWVMFCSKCERPDCEHAKAIIDVDLF